MADIAAEFAGDNGEVAKNIWKESNCFDDDVFKEMEENEKFVEDRNVMKLQNKIKNASGQYRIKKPDDSERDKILDYIEKEEGNNFRCTVCDKTSKRKYNMKDHVEKIHFPGMFSHACKFCDKLLESKQSFKKHKEVHKTKAGSGLLQRRNRNNHNILSDYIMKVQTEKNVDVFLCEVCGKLDKYKWKLVNHVESVHFPGCYIHCCKVCMKNFDTRQSFLSHMKNNHKKTIKAMAGKKVRCEKEEFVRKDETSGSSSDILM